MSGAAPSALFSSWYTQTLRGMAFVGSLIAAIAMGISRERISDPKPTKITSKDIACYMYFCGLHAVAAFYSLVVLVLPKTSLLWQSILASDVIVAMVLASISSATLGMFYIEKKGNSHADWSPVVCDLFSSYCQKVSVAVVAGYISLGMYFINIIICLCISLNPLLLQAPKKAPPPPEKPQQKNPA